MDIRVLEIRLLPGDKATRAFCDIEIDGIILKDFRVMQNGKRAYVKAPFNTYKNAAGEVCFRQIVDLPDEVRGQVDTAILSAFYRKKELSNGQQSQR